MRRTLQVLVLSTVLGASTAGVALAAGSPAIATGRATNIGDTTAVLNGTVNPNGHATQYDFTYGPTTAYGATTTLHTVKAGIKAVAITITVTGLTPGTTYHYRLNASNSGGAVAGADRAFTTTGHPPAAVVTGGAVSVGKTVATPTGVINPEGATTTWVIQYGLTPAYGMQNFPGALAGLTTPVSVAAQLTGLAPATLFHYRIVAFHGASVVSAGGDATFFTEPSIRPVPRMTAHTSPGRDKHSPYLFTTSGSLSGAGFIPAAQRCTGNVGVRFFNGRRQLAFVVAPIQTDCRFSVAASFRRLHSKGPAGLKVTVDYRGNGYIAPVNRTDHVTAG
ncbi:MAG: fibronectin type III domain-containing protein [Solirubrobacteraceae bacterium]